MLLARIELANGKRAKDAALIVSAGQRFADLGATVWQLRAEGAARAIRESQPWGAPTASADELIMDLVADGLSNASIADPGAAQRDVRQTPGEQAAAGDRQPEPRPAHRPRPPPVGPIAEPIPPDPAVAIAESAQPVAAVLGAPGSGRSTVLHRAQKLLADKGNTAILVRGGGR